MGEVGVRGVCCMVLESWWLLLGVMVLVVGVGGMNSGGLGRSFFFFIYFFWVFEWMGLRGFKGLVWRYCNVLYFTKLDD